MKGEVFLFEASRTGKNLVFVDRLFRCPERHLPPFGPHETSHLLFTDPQQERSEAPGLQPQLAAELAGAPTPLRGDAAPPPGVEVPAETFAPTPSSASLH